MATASITSEEFRRAVESDPEWAGKLTEDLEVVDYCDMDGSRIATLSPHLIFKGRDPEGNCASFRGCGDLDTAEGTFHGFVDFGPLIKEVDGEFMGEPCAISEMNLTVLAPNEKGEAVSVAYTENLTHAKGTYPGYVDCTGADILMSELVVTGTNLQGQSASFRDCSKLESLGGTYRGALDLAGVCIRRWGRVDIQKTDHSGKRMYVSGARIKGLAGQRLHYKEEEIGDLESANRMFLRAIVGQKKSKGGGMEAIHESQEPDAHPDEITESKVIGVTMLLRASSLKARETGAGWLDEYTYRKLRNETKSLINWDEGGLLPGALEEIRGNADFVELLPEMEKQNRAHRKYTRMRNELTFALQTGGSENPVIMKYYDVNKRGLTNLGVKLFGSHKSVRDAIAIIKPNGKGTIAEAFAEDHAMAKAGVSAKTKARGVKLTLSVIGMAALMQLGSVFFQSATERALVSPTLDWVASKVVSITESVRPPPAKNPGIPVTFHATMQTYAGAPKTEESARTLAKATLLRDALTAQNIEARRRSEEALRQFCGNPNATVSALDATDSILRDFQTRSPDGNGLIQLVKTPRVTDQTKPTPPKKTEGPQVAMGF